MAKPTVLIGMLQHPRDPLTSKWALARLHASGQALVSLVCRSNYKAIKAAGYVQMKTRDFGDYEFAPHAVFDSVDAAAKSGPWDYIVVTTKALPDVSDDSKLIQPLVDERSAIVLIQNGVGVEEPYRTRFPNAPIVSAVTVISAAQTSPGVIQQNRWTRISLGQWKSDHCDGRSRTEEFGRLMTAGGIKDVEIYDETDLQLLRWHKLTINSAFNPSSVLSGGAGNAKLALDPELRIHVRGIMDEITAAVPKLFGRSFPDKFAKSEAILRSTERNTAGEPSMLLDWRKGAPMELEVILGNPIRIAREQGVDLPRMQTLYALLKMAQSRRDAKI